MSRGSFGPWGFYVYITGRPAAWIVSVVFILVGTLIAFLLPSLLASSPDREFSVPPVRILGGAFLAMGILLLSWMLVDLYLSVKNPERREAWFWWGNFLAGLIGAGLFAIPATCAFPAILLFYLSRPNAVFPGTSADPSTNLLMGLAFSGAGILSLAMIFFIGRSSYRRRPRDGGDSLRILRRR